MVLFIGSMDVDSEGNETGGGMAQALYNAEKASLVSSGLLPDPAVKPADWVDGPDTTYMNASGELVIIKGKWADQALSRRVKMLQDVARRSLATATGLIPYLVAFTEVTVTIPNTVAGDGLQTSQTAGSPTTHPATNKFISGTIE